MNSRRLLASIGLVALVATSAQAQWNVARFSSTPNMVYSSFGLDPAMVATIGYARVVPLWNHPVQFSVDGGMVTNKADLNDFRARLGMRTALVRWRSVAVTGSAAFATRGTDNSIYQGLTFGAQFAGTGGVYRRNWFVASEFGFDKNVITHVTNSDWYRQFYPSAKDGWYLSAGGTFNYGLVAGVSIGKAELVGRAGWLRTQGWDKMIPPNYASLGLSFGF